MDPEIENASILSSVLPVSDSKTYLLSLKEVLSKLKNETSLLATEEIQQALVQAYFSCGPKYAAKRVLASFFQNLPESFVGKIRKYLEDQLTREIVTCELRNSVNSSDPPLDADFVRVRNVVEQINCLMENFRLGEECLSSKRLAALLFLSQSLEVFVKSSHQKMSPVERNEAMHHCLATIKTTNRLIQKSFPESTKYVDEDGQILGITESMLNSGIQILKQDDFLTDCRCGVGMVLVLLLKLLVGSGYMNLILGSIFKMKASNDENQSIKSGKTFDLSPFVDDDLSVTSDLCLHFGLLPMVDDADLCKKLDDDWILTEIFLGKILNFVDRCVDSGSKVLLGKTVTLWTTRTCGILASGECPKDLAASLHGEGHVISSILGYVWTTWDDQLDVLRQNARITYENCINIHRLAYNTDVQKDKFLHQSIQNLLDQSWTNKGKYGCLAAIVGQIGSVVLLEQAPRITVDILAQLEEQALACHASDLYEKLFKAHHRELISASDDSKDTSSWMKIWVQPVIQALCGSNKKLKLHIIEYILPKLLKFSRDSLHFMILALSKKDGASQGQIGALVMCVRRARALGLLNTDKTTGHDARALGLLNTDKTTGHDARVLGLLNTDKTIDKAGGPSGEKGSGTDSTEGLWCGLINPDILQYALTCADEQVRLDAFALLCENLKTSEPVTELEFSLLKLFLPLNLNNQTPAFRQYLLAYLNKLLVRLRESASTQIRLASKNKQNASSQTVHNIVHSYNGFLVWLQTHLFSGLYPGSAFARRLTCLAALVTLTQVFTGTDKKEMFSFHTQITSSHIQTLLECLTDTFEENKMAAVTLLGHCFQHGCGLNSKEELASLFSAAMELSSSTRPHDCTTAAHLFRVMLQQPIIVEVMGSYANDLKMAVSSELESVDKAEGQRLMLLKILLMTLTDQTDIAKKSLIVAAANRPMYPTMHCIRYILSDIDWRHLAKESQPQWKHYMDNLIAACLDVAGVVSPVVQDSSPEGNVPVESIMGPGLNVDAVVQTAEEKQLMVDAVTESEKTVTLMPEYLVVCCWRSIKEVSLILGQVCLHVTRADLVTHQQLKCIGEYFTTQLLESKHRGAFELAYAGFVQMCEMLWRSSTSELHSLPAMWLKEVMADITSDDPDSKLCATRRSAGVPFYVQALVSTEPVSTGRACFKSAICKLLELALEERSDNQFHNPQVHALNILRALYRDTRLGDDVTPFVADGLRASIQGFKSQVWAVRNSSTLLLSAMMTRIFGVKRSKDEAAMSKKNCQTGRAFFHRYPSLYQFLLKEIADATQDMDCPDKLHLHPSLYPVLMVLGRLFPSSLEGADTHLSLAAFIPYLLRCASSPVFKTRLMAARALQPLASKNQLNSLLLQLVAWLPYSPTIQMRQSHIHGILLMVEHLLALLPDMKSSSRNQLVEDLLIHWNCVTWIMTRGNKCVYTRKVGLDISSQLVRALETPDPLSTVATHLFSLTTHLWCVLLQEAHDQSYYPRHTPGLSDFYETVTKLCLQHFGQPQPEIIDQSVSEQNSKFREVVLKLLRSKVYEVRLRTLEVLNEMLHGKILKGRAREGGEVEKEDVDQSFDRRKEGNTGSRQTDVGIGSLMKSEPVYEQLLYMAVNSEFHHECLVLVYEILSVHPKSEKNKEHTEQIFKKVTTKLKSCGSRDEVKSAMLKFSSVLFPQVYSTVIEANDKSVASSLVEWCRVLQECSGTEQSADLQLTSAEILRQNAQLLLVDTKKKLNGVIFDLWEVVFDLLQEDDLEVKDTAARIYHSLEDNCSNNDLQPTLVLERMLSQFLECIGQHDPGGCIAALVSWVTNCEATGQAEGIRLFDKGEMNTYREDIIFIDLCCQQLRNIITMTTSGTCHIADAETIFTSALKKMEEKVSELIPVTEKTLFVDTSEYHQVYETVYRAKALVECVRKIPQMSSLYGQCTSLVSLTEQKFDTRFLDQRMNSL